jgi:hypothetical protein
MSKPLALTERQARALYRAAEKEGGIAEVKIGETTVRLIPAVYAQAEQPIDEERDIRL